MADEKFIEVISNALTNEVRVSELSAERIADIQADRELSILENQAKELARESALAKLVALGLTEEEIAAL
jgi:DNA-binding NarL/FixJ family response regulator